MAFLILLCEYLFSNLFSIYVLTISFNFFFLFFYPDLMVVRTNNNEERVGAINAYIDKYRTEQDTEHNNGSQKSTE